MGKVTRPGWTRRQVLQGGSAAGIGAALLPSLRAAQAREQRPNIIWIMADDLGYADLSFTGQRAFKTPNIDRIAREGLFLRQSYSNSAVCSATRTGLITGRYQYRLRVGLEEPIATGNENLGLDPGHPTLPSLLREQGYRTSLVGKWHLGLSDRFGPLNSGYESFYGVPFGAADYFRHNQASGVARSGQLFDGAQPANEDGYLTDLFSQRAAEEVGKLRRDPRPLFLSLHYTAPHWPWEGPEDEAVATTVGDLQHRDGGSLEIYRRMMLAMDAGVGKVLDALKRAGAARNTIVIFTSDNGGERFSDTWPFIGLKGELLEGGIRVPLFLRWPARIAAGSRSEQVNISMDWVPTLLAAAGTRPHPDYPSDGTNLLDIITGRAGVQPRRLFWRYKAATQAALRDGDWKYLKIRANEYLFNLAADERERANLARREASRLASMKEQWEAWNATMLPYPEGSVAYPNTGADRY
ncbi:MAG TPA: sulfatase-like hydrolase/transferase [Steroidobacteraceae bacterium]|nr:sulfatase-like hydrolase/transferase [Steroidobacteraceae bacterium]